MKNLYEIKKTAKYGETDVAENYTRNGEAITFGDYGVAITYGKDGHASAWGIDGRAVTHGESSYSSALGKNGMAFAYGKNGWASTDGENGKASTYGLGGQVRGSKLGSQLLIFDHETEEFVTEIIGEGEIEADTWYTLKGGEFVKAQQFIK